MEESGFSADEYAALRDELQTILQTRFNILTANIALVGVLVGVAFQDTATMFRPWLPLVLTAFILPSLVTNYYLSRHFTRIGGYLLARFEQHDNPYLFMTSLDHFKRRDKHYRAYSWPMLLTYLLLIVVGYAVAVIANAPALADDQVRIVLAAQICLTLPLLIAVIVATHKGRKTDLCFDDWWHESIAEAKTRWLDPSPGGAWVFVDRDGVINENIATHVRSVEEFHLLPGALEALAVLHRAGYGVVVITNQPVIDEKLMSVTELELVHRLLREAVESAGGRIDGIYYCPHPETQDEPRCACRKPGSGLLKQAAAEHRIDLSGAIVVGDQLTDVQAGVSVGAATILVETGRGADWLSRRETWEVEPDAVVADLLAAARLITEGWPRRSA